MNLVTGLWGMNVHVPGQEVGGVRTARLLTRRIAHALIPISSVVRLVWRYSGMSCTLCDLWSVDHRKSSFSWKFCAGSGSDLVMVLAPNLCQKLSELSAR
jgi:hypothetical protein